MPDISQSSVTAFLRIGTVFIGDFITDLLLSERNVGKLSAFGKVLDAV